MTRLHAILVAIVAALTLLALPAASPAATYTISQCDARTGAALPGWTTLTSGAWKATSTCPKNLNFKATGSGKYAVLRTPVLPAELGIARVSFLAAGLRSKGARPEGGFCKTYPAKSLCKRQITRRAAKRSRETHSNEFVWHQHGNKPGARAFEIGVRSTSGKSTTSAAYLDARHFKFTINDNTAPKLNIASSSAATGWASGQFSVTVDASDAGGGVAGFWLDATGAADAASRHFATSCNYNKWQPCPLTTSKTFTVDTSEFASGTATLSLSSEDAAGNRSTAKTVSFNVDNVAPPQPGPLTFVGNSCVTKNISWSYPTTSDNGSPFTTVRVTYAMFDFHYDTDFVGTMGPQTTVDLPVGSTSTTFGDVSLTGLTAVDLPRPHPNENDYVFSVQIVDAAGNASPAQSTWFDADNCPS